MNGKKNLRTPIVCIMGHVNHGKTTMLDKIRGTTIATREPGSITQHIGATEVPIESIIEKCINDIKNKFIVPGLLFIDTPGHHAFTTLRSRGGALADLAVVVVDINESFKPQTIESLNILKRFKTPFIVVTNKIDKIHGWKTNINEPFIKSYKHQDENTKTIFEKKFYEIIGKLYEHGFNADRYDRITDFKKTIGVVPISGFTGEGISDVLIILLGLAQKFLESNLIYDINGPGIGTVLEVKEEKGLGVTIDVILYDGTLQKGDSIIIGCLDKPIETKIRALFKPKELTDIRYENKFKQVNKISAASGIKIVASGIEKALSGSPIIKTTEDTIEKLRNKIKNQINDIQIKTDSNGIIIKADTIGSLEALVHEFKKINVNIRKAEVGDVTKRDVTELSTIKDIFYSVIIAFNIKINTDALEIIEQNQQKIFSNDVIYRLIDDYQDHIKKLKENEDGKYSEIITSPCKFKILLNCIFRQSKPAVVGVRILGGIIKNNTEIILSNGANAGVIKGLELDGKKIQKATIGMEVSMAIEGVTVGKQINEEDILYSSISEKEAKILEYKMFDNLNNDQKETLNDYLILKRKDKPFWGK